MEGEKILKITGLVFVAVPQEADPEEVASEFNLGFRSAVEHFPGGEVVSADIEQIEVASEEEINERGLTE